jgi:hypothetical protein
MMPRPEKFRQAAFAYLLVGILYEGAAWAMWRRGLLPADRGPGWLWMLIGAAIVAVVFWGLWKWQNVWFARGVFVIHALRVPTLIGHAFFAAADQKILPAFYLTALIVVVANLWMLGRAAWDV